MNKTKNYRPESDCGNYPVTEFEYDNHPYESKNPYKHKWPPKDLASYVIDGLITIGVIAAITFIVVLIVNAI